MARKENKLLRAPVVILTLVITFAATVKLLSNTPIAGTPAPKPLNDAFSSSASAAPSVPPSISAKSGSSAGPGIGDKNFLSLSSGVPPPLAGTNIAVRNAGPGNTATGMPPDVQSFDASISFGDLALVTNGMPAQAAIGLRVRGDQAYVLTVSELTMNITNLQYHGADLGGSADRGSFLRLGAGSIVGTGTNANLSGSNINPVLFGDGLNFNQLYQGSVSANATQIMSGSRPSLAGSASSATNAIDVPVYILAPTGLALGPVSGGSPGTFNCVLQFGVFVQP